MYVLPFDKHIFIISELPTNDPIDGPTDEAIDEPINIGEFFLFPYNSKWWDRQIEVLDNGLNILLKM